MESDSTSQHEDSGPVPASGDRAVTAMELLHPKDGRVLEYTVRGPERGPVVLGMGAQNHVLFGVVSRGEQEQRAIVSQMAAAVRDGDAAELAAGMASLFPEVDAAELAGAYGADNTAHMNHGLAAGDDGWLEDFQALTVPWGFDPGDITVPVELWHGTLDRMVPVAHGQWPAAHLPTVRAHIESGHGHISIGVGSLGDKLDRLRSVQS